MPHFTPTRPPATRLLIPIPPDLQAADRALAAALARRPPHGEAARLTARALNLAVPSKGQALTGYLGTLAPHQRTAVVARNALEKAAATAHAHQAGARPTADPARWRIDGGTLVLTASPEMDHEDLSGALYLIFLGRPLRLSTLQRLEAMAASTGPHAPPHVIHLIASPSLDNRIADILPSPDAGGSQPQRAKRSEP